MLENGADPSLRSEFVGMTPLQALQSATTDAAELLGVDDRGQLQAGMLADIIAVRSNPLDDIRVMEDVVFVMQGGRVIRHFEAASGAVE